MGRTLSHGLVQHPLDPQDDFNFPSVTERGPHTDAYLEETRTGLVSAKEVEAGIIRDGSVSELANTAVDVELGEKAEDAKIVTWTENDPGNPRHFSAFQKWMTTIMVTLLCLDVAIASSIITGGLDKTAAAMHVSEEVINLTVSLFVVGFGVGPLFFAPLSEMYGRRIVYLISIGVFCIFTIPCAVAKNAATIIVCRAIGGLAASAPMTNAAGSIADVWEVHERGPKMAIYSAMLFAGPCIGPLIGGYISDNTSWRWIYWVLLIFSCCVFVICLIFGQETYAPILLRRKAEKLRKETGDMSIMTEQERFKRPTSEVIKESLLRPLVILCTEWIMICFSAYLSLIYGLLYGFFFSYPIVFAQGHHFTNGQTGLTFMGIFIGIVFTNVVVCPLQERWYQARILKLKESGESITPEARLPLMMGNAILLPISLFIFAWTSLPSVSWVGPAVAGIPFGVSLVGIYISANSYIIDAYPKYGASAMAAKTFVRSLCGASVPMWIAYMYARLGNGWAGSLLAFISLGMAPIPFLFYKYGASIRATSSRAS